MTLGQALFDGLRKAIGIIDEGGSTAAIAHHCGVSYRTVLSWRKGERDPHPNTLADLADRYGIRLAREPGGSWVASVAGGEE